MAMEIGKLPPVNPDRDQRPTVPRRKPTPRRRPPAATAPAPDEAGASPTSDKPATERHIDVQA